MLVDHQMRVDGCEQKGMDLSLLAACEKITDNLVGFDRAVLWESLYMDDVSVEPSASKALACSEEECLRSGA